MKSLLKLFDFNYYSFSAKVIFSLFIFIAIFISIKIGLDIPVIKEKNLKNEINFITKSLIMTKEKIQIIGKSIKMQRDLEIELSKKNIENELNKFKINTINDKHILFKILDKIKFIKTCNIDLKENIKNSFFEKWEKQKNIYIYTQKLDFLDKTLTISCPRSTLNPNHATFEKELKKYMHTELLKDSSLKKVQTVIFWLNLKNIKNKDEVLFEKDLTKSRKKYLVSNLSNVKNLPTGNLTTNDILNAKDKNEVIFHKIDKEEKLTWILDLSSNSKNSKRKTILIHTLDKKELENKNNSNLLFSFPETLIAIGISFIFVLLLFKRLFKNINTLTKTALIVNKGNTKIRSKVKGEDDIGILGQSFDSMLDFFENNIKTLDKKVEEKTKEISKSLEEKETLLKEIHHRVKNNLALTIGLIELQEEELVDKKVRKTLVDIKERIFTMELLHRKLYESNNLNNISFKKYVIELVETISKTYDIENKVVLDLKISDINMDIEVAMSCGIVLNELITNAFKYAFNDKNKKDNLKIIVKKEQNDITIIVKDSGNGLDKDFDILSDKTLGLKLVKTIVKIKLFGDVFYKYEEGAKFIIQGKINSPSSIKKI